MCRNIRPLFNFQPPATDEEIRAAALLDALATTAAPKDRAVEAAKARARSTRRFQS